MVAGEKGPGAFSGVPGRVTGVVAEAAATRPKRAERGRVGPLTAAQRSSVL